MPCANHIKSLVSKYIPSNSNRKIGDMSLTAASFWVITVLTSNNKINASVSHVSLNAQDFHVKNNRRCSDLDG